MLSKKSLNIAIFFTILTALLLVTAMIGTVSAGISTGMGVGTTPIVADSTAPIDSNPIDTTTDTPTDTTTPTTPTDTTTTNTNTGSGSSGSSNGGSYSGSQPVCLSKVWNCTGWTECKNSTQTRVCTLTRTDCKAQEKPEESVKCIATTIDNSKESNLTNQNSTEEELDPKTTGITASVIGAKILDNWIIITSIIFIVIIIILAYFFYSKAKK